MVYHSDAELKTRSLVGPMVLILFGGVLGMDELCIPFG